MLLPLPESPSARRLPRLTQAKVALTREVEVRDEFGQRRTIQIPAERPLTLFVDKRELVTLMTLGAAPELLALGYLRNQRLVDAVDDVESITVDWDVEAAAVQDARAASSDFDRGKTARRVVTTGCGQGTMFGHLMDELDAMPAAVGRRGAHPPVDAARHAQRSHAQDRQRAPAAGSVHGCALFRGTEMLNFVEDVGRHNAIDTIAGWMWLQGDAAGQGADKVFYTTGRLTSEMVMKSAQLGVPIIVSRNGVTQMGHELAVKPRHDAVRPCQPTGTSSATAASSASTPSRSRSARRCAC